MSDQPEIFLADDERIVTRAGLDIIRAEARREALREAREAVESLRKYGGGDVMDLVNRPSVLLAIGALMGGSPK